MRALAILLIGPALLGGCARHEVAALGERPSAGYEWHLPPGFPVPLVPPDNPMSAEKVRLGRYLFYDQRLSGNGTQSCASCHRQELAFTDGRATAVGSTGRNHFRSTMGLANVAYNASLTWADRRTRSLEEQAIVPMFSERPVEMGVSGNEREILSRLAEDRRYPVLFHAAFQDDPDPIRLENVVRALAAFERTLVSGDSPYDRLVYHDERQALSGSARRGMRLFFSDALACSGCHAGFNFSGPVNFEGVESIEPTFHNTGLYGAYPEVDRGLYDKTHKRRHRGRFRAPSLRNVALTGPYMHDGSVETLRAVIELYAAGGRHGTGDGDGRAHPNKSGRISGFSIDERGIEDLLAFLRSLTDEAFVTDPRFSDPFRGGPELSASELSRIEDRLGGPDDL